MAAVDTIVPAAGRAGLGVARHESPSHSTLNGPKARAIVWLGALAGLSALLALLTLAVKAHPFSSSDRAVLDWVHGWHGQGVDGFLGTVSFLSDNWPSDVAGGYLLGLLAILAFVRLYSLIERGRYPALSFSAGRLGTVGARAPVPGSLIADAFKSPVA